MEDPTFNLFGPLSNNDIRVGYISTDRGYQTGVTVCDANEYAKLNPGTTFIFRPNRKKVEFLNINEVNELASSPVRATTDEACPGGLDMNSIPDPPKVVFLGGGGVGAVANPIIGDDGAVLAIDLLNGGFGYKYPPITEIRDDSGIGAGAVVKVEVGKVEEQLIYYSDKEDFEDPIICKSPLPADDFGRRYGPDGKDIGKWSPQDYTDGTVPFSQVVDDYMKKVQESGKDWWTTRKNPPLNVTSTGQNTTFFKVNHPSWGGEDGFMNKYAISPVPPSNVKPSDHAGKWYTFEWNVDFPYDGEYIFRTARDDKSKLYIDSVPFTDKLQTFTGTKLLSGKAGKTGGFGNKLTLKKGLKVLRLDLYNQPQKETITVQQAPPSSTRDITFKITSGSMFANGVTIKDLNIDEVKPFTRGLKNESKLQLNVSHTRKIEYGKKYKVVFTSKGKSGVQGDIKYNGLHPANKNIRVVRGGKRIELKDGHGNDTNFSLDIDSGKGKFSTDGRQLQGSGNIKITASWNDNPNTASVAVESIQIGGKTWRRSGRRGSQTNTVNLSVQPTGIKLRITEPNIIQMEDFTDNDWTDIIVTATGGQFTDLKGAVAYFSVPYPPDKKGKSKSSKGIQTREVFNTIDYISKANRQLWRTNVYSKGGFINDYGICPFDTKLELKDNPYAGDHNIVWPNVNFPIDGNYTIEVAVDDNVDLTIGDQVNLTKKGFTEGVSTGTLKTTRFIKGGNHNITAKLNQIPGGAFSFRSSDGKKKKKKIKFNVWIGGSYGNRMTIPGLFSLAKDYKGAGAALNREIEVEVGKEYDVILTSIRSRGGAASSDVRKGAIRFRNSGGGIDSSGPRLEYEDLLGRIDASKSWKDITAGVSEGRFYAVDGNRCKFMVGESEKGINPMALAINIETEFSEKEIQAKRSWNENPMGVALTIDAPNPPIPQQPVPKSEGRCPNNPFWTTRFPGAKQRWYPVRVNGWGTLLNELAMSPIPPSDEGDARNDSGSFTNTWTKSFPYGGYYKVKMEVDDIGEFWIDDEKVLDLSRRKGITQDEKLIYIEGPDSPDDEPVTHEIKVVVENYKSLKTKLIDAKVFNTLDWISGGTSKSAKKRVNFKITSGALFANGIDIPELFIFASKRYDGPQINQNFERDVEVNKVYDVELFSTQSRDGVRLRTRGESVLEMEEATDNDWSDLVCGATEGRFFDFKPGPNKATCKFVVTAATKVSGGVSGSTTRQGVTYEGPHLFHYQDKRWGKIINNEGISPIGSPTQSLSESNPNIIGMKKLKWKNVDFPKTGDYHITFLADNGATLLIGGKKVLASKTYEINEYTNDVVKVDKGKHDILVELDNASSGGNIFLNNPTGVALRITTKERIGTGDYLPWTQNPVGVAAKLIPPPCPKKVEGKGRIVDPIVEDPGNGYPKTDGSNYNVLLKVKEVVVKDPGINYDCTKDTIRLEPSMGSELKLKCGPFGRIEGVDVIKAGLGFTRMPAVIIESGPDRSPGSPTGVNLDVAIQFEPEIAPFDVPDVIQVTDLVGLKQTGYYRGRPYYGAVFFENGVKYSGWYRTAGEMVQVYDTMQESIDAEVTTPPSAILRQGSDTSSNDPRINIPRTPENLI